MTRITLDKDELEKLSGVKLGYHHIEQFVDVLTTYAKRFRGPRAPDFMLVDGEKLSGLPIQDEMEARRATIAVIESIWRECGGRGDGVYLDKYECSHSGKLLKLIQKLLAAIGENPSAATVFHDVNAVRGVSEVGRRQKSKP